MCRGHQRGQVTVGKGQAAFAGSSRQIPRLSVYSENSAVLFKHVLQPDCIVRTIQPLYSSSPGEFMS